MSKADDLRKENNEFSKNLTKENHIIYTDIVCYLRVSKLNDQEQEEVISDILRMFLDSQEEGNSIQSVIGEDYKKFADDILGAINPKKSITDIIKEYYQIIIQAICILLTIDLVTIYLPKILKGDFNLKYDYTLDMLMRFFIILIASISVFNYIGRNSFKFTDKKMPKWKNFTIGGVIVGSVTGVFVGVILLFRNIVLVSISVYYLIPIPIIYWGYIGVKKLAK